MRTLFVLIFLLVLQLSVAQNQDSLYRVYVTQYATANELLVTDPESAVEYYQQCSNTLELLLRNSDTNGFFAFRNDFMKEYDEKLYILESSKQLVTNLDTTVSQIEVLEAYDRIIKVVTWQSSVEERLKWNYEALAYSKSISDTSNIIRYTVGVADLNSRLHFGANAKKHFANAWQLLSMTNTEDDLKIYYLQRYASFKNTIEEIDSAIIYSNKVISLMGDGGTLDQRGTTFNELAYSHNRTRELEIALNFSDKAIASWLAKGDGDNLTIAYINKANTLNLLNRTDEYLETLRLALIGAMENGVFWVAESSTRKLSRQYAKQGNYRKAYAYERIGRYVEGFEKKLNKIEETLLVEAKYEMTDNVARIEAQQGLIKQVELEKELQSRYWLFTIIVAVLLAMAVLVGLYFYRKLNKSKTQLAIQKDELEEQRETISLRNEELGRSLEQNEVLLREVHHRVKNNLTILSGLLFLQEKSLQNKSDKDFLVDCQNRIYSMALVHQKLYEDDDLSVVNFEAYCQELVANIAKANSPTDKEVTFEVACHGIKLNIDVAVPLALIITELVTNSFKHAFKDQNQGVIGVDLSIKKDQYQLHVFDNGKGIRDYGKINQSKSLGFRLIRLLSRQLFGEVEYINKEKSSFFVTFKA